MLSLPLKLTRDQTSFLKANNLVCVGTGFGHGYNDTGLFKASRPNGFYIDLENKAEFKSKTSMMGNIQEWLYFLPRPEFQRLGLTERSDLIVPYVAKPRASKPAYRYALLGDSLIEKFTPSTYQAIYKSSGPNGREQNSCPLSTIESRIKSGNMKELTHAEFVAKINSWGWNEDGTKIAPPAPPKPAPVPRFDRENVGQVWMIDGGPHMVCQTAADTYRIISLKIFLGNRFRDNDTIPEGARMVAPTLMDYFKNKLES